MAKPSNNNVIGLGCEDLIHMLKTEEQTLIGSTVTEEKDWTEDTLSVHTGLKSVVINRTDINMNSKKRREVFEIEDPTKISKLHREVFTPDIIDIADESSSDDTALNDSSSGSSSEGESYVITVSTSHQSTRSKNTKKKNITSATIKIQHWADGSISTGKDISLRIDDVNKISAGVDNFSGSSRRERKKFKGRDQIRSQDPLKNKKAQDVQCTAVKVTELVTDVETTREHCKIVSDVKLLCLDTLSPSLIVPRCCPIVGSPLTEEIDFSRNSSSLEMREDTNNEELDYLEKSIDFMTIPINENGSNSLDRIVDGNNISIFDVPAISEPESQGIHSTIVKQELSESGLHTIDEKESICTVVSDFSNITMPESIKCIKQKKKCSEFGVVNMRADEDGGLTESQLFKDNSVTKCCKNIELSGEEIKDHLEEIFEDHPDVIVLADSDEEDNSCCQRLPRSQLLMENRQCFNGNSEDTSQVEGQYRECDSLLYRNEKTTQESNERCFSSDCNNNEENFFDKLTCEDTEEQSRSVLVTQVAIRETVVREEVDQTGNNGGTLTSRRFFRTKESVNYKIKEEKSAPKGKGVCEEKISPNRKRPYNQTLVRHEQKSRDKKQVRVENESHCDDESNEEKRSRDKNENRNKKLYYDKKRSHGDKRWDSNGERVHGENRSSKDKRADDKKRRHEKIRAHDGKSVREEQRHDNEKKSRDEKRVYEENRSHDEKRSGGDKRWNSYGKRAHDENQSSKDSRADDKNRHREETQAHDGKSVREEKCHNDEKRSRNEKRAREENQSHGEKISGDDKRWDSYGEHVHDEERSSKDKRVDKNEHHEETGAHDEKRVRAGKRHDDEKRSHDDKRWGSYGERVHDENRSCNDNRMDDTNQYYKETRAHGGKRVHEDKRHNDKKKSRDEKRVREENQSHGKKISSDEKQYAEEKLSTKENISTEENRSNGEKKSRDKKRSVEKKRSAEERISSEEKPSADEKQAGRRTTSKDERRSHTKKTLSDASLDRGENQAPDMKRAHDAKRSGHVNQKASNRVTASAVKRAENSDHRAKSHKDDVVKRQHYQHENIGISANTNEMPEMNKPISKDLHNSKNPRLMPKSGPVVLLTKLNHVNTRVEIVKPPYLINGDQRAVSNNIINVNESPYGQETTTSSQNPTQFPQINSREFPSTQIPNQSTSQLSKRDLVRKSKIEQKIHLRDQKRRRIENPWADILPLSKEPSKMFTRQEIKEIRLNRKKKLRELAEQKKNVGTEELTPKRIAAQSAKVTEEPRGYFLFSEPLERPARRKASKASELSKITKPILFANRTSKVKLLELEPKKNLNKCDPKEFAPLLVRKQSDATNKKVYPILEKFLMQIFEWNPRWLEEQNELKTVPPVVDESKLTAMRFKYRTYEEYYNIAEPLLILEMWNVISRDFNLEKVNLNMFSIVRHLINPNSIHLTNVHVNTLTLEIIVSKRDMQLQAHPVYGDLLFFEYFSNTRDECGFVSWKLFAYVTELRKTVITPLTYFNRDLLRSVKDPHTLLSCTVMTKAIDPKDVQFNTVNKLTTITYLRSYMRMVQALQYLPASLLMNIILNPKIEDYQLPPAINVKDYPLVTKDHLNVKQLEAVVRITSAVIQALPKICLIQGPPGTGKSKVIVNLVTQILYGDGRYQGDKKLRILVCAPSNAATDEIVLRLLDIQKLFEKENRFNLVRIGRIETMHPLAKLVSLKELATKDVNKTNNRYSSPSFGDNVVADQCDILERKELEKMHRLAENTLLKKADVIACTLTSCYTNQMESVFAGSDETISVCIVDEATQSAEPETLIPLMLGVSTLVLVGDTNQLPATVLSQKAKQFGLDQSLFARIWRTFEGEANNPIIQLDTQYRMTNPVAHFPNKYFYAGILTNAAIMRKLPFHFYRVINLDSTQDRIKFSNSDEAYFVAQLIYTIIARTDYDNAILPVKVGIITPYNDQKMLLKKTITERIARLKNKNKIMYEVNTVDSFQGQERDVVIMSCVRSSGIGFLSDRQRLCVALTRAKHSLILCGNFRTFQKYPMWKALLSDAQSRGVYVNVKSNANPEDIRSYIIR